MIQAETINQLTDLLEKSFIKAAANNPQVTVLRFGLYVCDGSNGNRYNLSAGRTSSGKLYIDCSCAAGEKGKACYHAARVFEIHTEIARKRKENERAKQTEKKPL